MALVEHRTGIAEVMGSNPVEALIIFRLLLSNCLNWKIYCADHTSLSNCFFVDSYTCSHKSYCFNVIVSKCKISALYICIKCRNKISSEKDPSWSEKISHLKLGFFFRAEVIFTLNISYI